MRGKPGRTGRAFLCRTVLLCLHALGRVAGHLMFAARGKRYRVAHVNLNLAYPRMSARELSRLNRAALGESGKLSLEMLFHWSVRSTILADAVVGIRGEHHLREARRAGKGVVLICPHLGNWEVFNLGLGRYTPYVAYKPLSRRAAETWVRRCRERTGSALVPLTAQGIRTLRRRLDQGGIVIAFPDQAPRQQAGRVKAPFFGVPAWTGTLVPRLAARPGVVVLCGCARRLPRGRGFEILLEPAPPEIGSGDAGRSAAALNLGIERLVRRWPAQYLWEYKRFKQTLYPRLYDRSRPYRHKRGG